MKKSKYSSKMRGGRKSPNSMKNTKYSSMMKKGTTVPSFNEVVQKKTGGKV